jgi:hypothetical protein
MAELAARLVDQFTWKPVEVGAPGCTFEMDSGVGEPPLALLPLTMPAQPAKTKLRLEMSRRTTWHEIWFAVLPLERTLVDDIGLSPVAVSIGRQS